MGTENARRMRRPSWRDPRLGVGLVLVATSVAVGSWAVGSANATVPVYAADRALTPGVVLEDAVILVDVSPGIAGAYLGAGADLSATVDRVVLPGELVPVSAVVAEEAVALRAVVVPAGAPLPDGVGPGTRVDVWFNPDPPSGANAPAVPAHVVAGDVLVQSVSEAESMFGGAGYGSVQVLVGEDVLPAVLQAMSSDGSLVIVPGA